MTLAATMPDSDNPPSEPVSGSHAPIDPNHERIADAIRYIAGHWRDGVGWPELL